MKFSTNKFINLLTVIIILIMMTQCSKHKKNNLWLLALLLPNDNSSYIQEIGDNGSGGSGSGGIPNILQLDTNFNSNGIVINDNGTNDEIRAITIDSNQRILLAGTSDGDFAILRYLSSGSIDSSFGTSGKVIMDINDNGNIDMGRI